MIFFVETVIHFYFQDSEMNRKFKRTALFETEIFCNIINVFTDQLNAFLMNKSIDLDQRSADGLTVGLCLCCMWAETHRGRRSWGRG